MTERKPLPPEPKPPPGCTWGPEHVVADHAPLDAWCVIAPDPECRGRLHAFEWIRDLWVVRREDSIGTAIWRAAFQNMSDRADAERSYRKAALDERFTEHERELHAEGCETCDKIRAAEARLRALHVEL